MYDNFMLRQTPKGNIAGYQWDLENPDRVICIVHGIGEYGGRFDRIAEAFRQQNMACLALDLRGHGISLGKQGDCAPRREVLEDVTALLDVAAARYPQKEIILYGHSMGGNIVLDYRARGQKNMLPQAYIVSAPWIKLVRPVPKPLYRVIKAVSRMAPSLTISSEVSEADLGHPERVKPYHENPMVHNKISALCAVDGFEIGLKLMEGTLEDNGAASQIPMLLMHGSADRICDVSGSRALAERLQSEGQPVEYLEWEGLFHEIHNGNDTSKGDEVVEKMVAWAKCRG